MKKLISWLLIILNIHLIKKEVKLRYYNDALHLYKANCFSMGLCVILSVVTKSKITISKTMNKMYLLYPEVYVQKPSKTYTRNSWFSYKKMGEIDDIRIKVLETAITTLK